MDTGRGVCTDCSGGTTTKKRQDDLWKKKKRSRRDKLQNKKASQKGRSKEGTKSSAGDDRRQINDSMAQLYTEPNIPSEFSKLVNCDVFALGEYYPEDKSNDKYSRNIISFCKREEIDKLEYFVERLDFFFDKRSISDLDPDIITAYPGHAGGVSKSVVKLLEKVTADRKFEYRQVICRKEPRPKQRNQSHETRWSNQKDSIAVRGDVDGRTVLLFDDIVTSGASMCYGTKSLLENGAELVVCVSLGLTVNQRGQLVKQLKTDEHTVASVMSN